MNKLLAVAMLASTCAAAPAFAQTSFAGVIGASGVSDYRFHFAGGSFSAAVDSAGSNPIFDPSVYVFADNGSSLSAKTGALLFYNDDFNGLNSYVSGPLASGDYILSISHFFFNETAARSASASTAYAGLTYNVTLSAGATTGAVPEPATWAMMILGMGAVGFAMRRRKNVNMTVSFA